MLRFDFGSPNIRAMTLQDLIDEFGSQAEVARRLGVNPASVCEWAKTGVPGGRQYQAELITGGKLRAIRPADRRRVAA